MNGASGVEKLELLVSYILIFGVITSLAIEIIGIVNYHASNGNFAIIFQPIMAMQGRDFFAYSWILITQLSEGAWTPTETLSAGIVVLMITPYLRVVASVAYFGLAKNPKYLAITLIVLVVLTASLLIH